MGLFNNGWDIWVTRVSVQRSIAALVCDKIPFLAQGGVALTQASAGWLKTAGRTTPATACGHGIPCSAEEGIITRRSNVRDLCSHVVAAGQHGLRDSSPLTGDHLVQV